MTEQDNVNIRIIGFALFTVLIFLFALALTVRYRKRKKETDQLKTQFAAELQKVRVEIQEETLQHISRELHDNIGHAASLVKIHLNTIDTNNLPALGDKIEHARELMRDLIADLKTLSVSLRNDLIVNKGFMAAVEYEIAKLKKTDLFLVSLRLADDFVEPTGENALVVFRMIQEGINNIIKHSQATEVSIKAYMKDNYSILELMDNGVGFNPNRQPLGGAGLTNLRVRAALIRADLRIKSEQSQGTLVAIRLPS